MNEISPDQTQGCRALPFCTWWSSCTEVSAPCLSPYLLSRWKRGLGSPVERNHEGVKVPPSRPSAVCAGERRITLESWSMMVVPRMEEPTRKPPEWIPDSAHARTTRYCTKILYHLQYSVVCFVTYYILAATVGSMRRRRRRCCWAFPVSIPR